MKAILVLLASLLAGTVLAQSGTSPNLVDPTVGNSQLSLTGTVNYSGTGGGLSGGSVPGYNITNNTIYFGYNQGTAALTYAFTQALQNSGMTILGYNYSWQYINQGFSAGSLSAAVNFAATNGSLLHSKNWALGPTQDWTTVSGTENFANPGLLAASIANFSLSFTGKDNRWWAGYYGPQVRNPLLSLNYTFDSCSSNPLSSPSCPGYEQAYFTQQCTANPLYNSACPGYAQAYYTQQCTANPLYDSGCPGYAQAYFTQQCTANPLYNTACPGYAKAYYDQQCSLNGLYDRNCPNYATAYATKQLTSTTTTTTTNTTITAVSDPVTTATNPVSVATTQPATTSTTSPTSVTSVTSVIAPASAPVTAAPTQSNTTTTTTTAQSNDQQRQDTKKTETTVASIEKKAESKSDAKAAATERAKQIAKQAGNATSMESQMETQGQLLGLMGYVPGFTAYQNTTLRDINEREMMKKYSKDNVDNRSLLRRLGGASEIRWSEMVDGQYKMQP